MKKILPLAILMLITLFVTPQFSYRGVYLVPNPAFLPSPPVLQLRNTTPSIFLDTLLLVVVGTCTDPASNTIFINTQIATKDTSNLRSASFLKNDALTIEFPNISWVTGSLDSLNSAYAYYVLYSTYTPKGWLVSPAP